MLLMIFILLPAILIPACASSSLVFCMMYSAYRLSKQADKTQHWRTPFPIWNQSIVPCPVLTVASWPAHRFLRRQAGQVVWHSHLLRNFPQLIVIHTAKGFGIVNKAEIDVFLELSCFFNDSMDVGNLISGSSAFSKSSLNIWSSWFTYSGSLAWRILSITLLACEISAIVWLALPFFGTGMKTDPFYSCGHCRVFQIC